jgi:hypothetical protein
VNSRGRRTQRRAAERREYNARRSELIRLQLSYRPKRKKRKIKNDVEKNKMSAHMTFDQAISHALHNAAASGYRYRVYKSRNVVGWWNVVASTTPLGHQGKRCQGPSSE